MNRALRLWLVAALLGAGTLKAQVVRIGVHGVAVTHNEINQALRADGFGAGGLLGLSLGRFSFEAKGYWAEVDPTSPDRTSFDILQVDARAGLLVARSIAFEVGIGRRVIDPDFAAQDVGLVRVGILSEYPLSRLARVWARGSYLIAPQFSGGGTAGLSVELGLGTAIGTADGRFRVVGEYEFQRLDREVKNRNVPIQLTVVRFGVELGVGKRQ